jgi:hypothetical protein
MTGTNGHGEWRAGLIPECETRQDECGRWYGRHLASGETFEAGSLRALECIAMVKRVLHSWRQAETS